MKLYLSKGRIWTGTQADAKAAQGGTDYESIEVPTSKPELIVWLNEQWAKLLDRDAPTETVTIATADMRADKGGAPSISHEVPVNPEPAVPTREAQVARFEAVARKMGWVPKAEAPTPSKRDLAEEITGLEGQALYNALSAAIGRLGETAGVHGWAAFSKNIYSWTPSSKSVEQGLGMLMLASLNNLGLSKISNSDSDT